MPVSGLSRSLSAGDVGRAVLPLVRVEEDPGSFSLASRALCPLSIKAPMAVTSALGRLRSGLIQKHGLSIDQVNQQVQELQRRQDNLALAPEHAVFCFERIQPPTSPSLALADREGYVLPKPMDVAKKVLSQEYFEKFGIYVKSLSMEAGTSLDFAQEMVAVAIELQPQPVGFVVPVTHGQGPHNTLNHRGHVLAIALQKLGSCLEIFNLDTLAQDSQYALDIVQSMADSARANGIERIDSFLAEDSLQGDKHSCHTGSYQLLKDLLVAFKAAEVVSLRELLLSPGRPEGLAAQSGRRFILPSFLHKSTQLSSAFRKAEPHDPLVVAHRKKYLAAFQSGAIGLHKMSNHFLTIKALHNANKVLNRLESMNAEDRATYIGQI